MRAIDFHVHFPTVEWLEGSMGPYRESAENYFNMRIDVKTVEQMALEYEALDVVAVLLGWDAETATGRPGLRNDDVASVANDFPERFIPFAGIDPHKPDAIDELERCISQLGMKGAKFHPSMQRFDPSDEAFFPLWQKAGELGIACIFHTGTSGIGARTPGGQGIRIDLARPILLDPAAAAFPDLKIVMAHFGWPWHLEAIAMALHKTNVLIDTSGWAPRYIPAEVVREMKGRLKDSFVWGSDYPFISPSRCLEEMKELGLGADAARRVLLENAAQLLGVKV
ncbi:MAG: amidohydrolase family protein [Actinomycetota bacterium]|nr:amidohydrolase family protein [Actinomycetota bacterium]